MKIAKMKKNALLFALFIAQMANAQLTSDAFLLSNNSYRATARALGVGNAMSAIGGDISVASTNPAGLAVSRKSEFIISPQMNFSRVDADFASENLSDTRAGLALGSLGLMLSNPLDGKWKTFNFLLSYNKINNFNQNMSYSGVSFGSRLQRFALDANGTRYSDLNPLESQLAYDTYMIDLVDTANFIYTSALGDSNFVRKSQFVKQSGYNNELGISAAANYNDKLFIGGTLGIDVLRYKEFKSYEEFEETGSIDFKRMTFDETRSIKGVGINFKGGLLYKFNRYFRMGAHIHTPTLYRNTETYSTVMFGEIVYNGRLEQNSYPSLVQGQYLYTVRTPWTLGLSAGAVLGTKGFFSAEVEYLNYKNSNFGIAANDTSANIATKRFLENLNRNVDGVYKGAFRVRVGGEIVASKVARLRAGYQLQTSPYQVAVDGVSDLQHAISFGFGLRTQGVFFDLGYSHFLQQFLYSPYSPTSISNIQNVKAKSMNGLVSITFGFRFI